MTWVGVLIWSLTAVALLYTCWRVEKLKVDIATETAAHTRCHEHTVALVEMINGRSDAAVLKAAAEAWGSIEEQANLKRLANEKYTAGGPSMPVIWLRDRAERLAQ